ncbi:MAG: hypothetical protein A3D10_03475 [Omnitrophica WOR_2 bacterium RIFCSPHIGHO2_02_FULL_48_11]|nr:MAG: hypothetical protein A3D10_03475 [Omnitrophica WOR_2 bacterium RIFCSPHIGHO2_02_FULL_48_11]
MMNIAQIKIQYDRLERHYSAALKEKDPISFLDLSHTLRIWVDMKSFVDDLTRDKKITLELGNPVTPSVIKEIFKGSRYTFLLLASGVQSPGVETRALRITKRALSSEEIKRIAAAGPPTARSTQLSFSEWLGSGVYGVPSSDEKHPRLELSRLILIKRIANILGASHPAGTEEAEATENKFDVYITDLHNVHIANGYPATYYQLLEIAKDILVGTKCLFE